MKLKEKFQEWHDSPTNKTVAENIIELEKIADDYAIEFAHWMHNNCFYNGYSLYKMYVKGDEQFELEELLEIFKKEKGL
jgi:hypothetical protein